MASKTLEIVLKGSDQGGTRSVRSLNKTLKVTPPQLKAIKVAAGGVGKALKFSFFDMPNKIFGTFFGLLKKATIGITGVTAATGAASLKVFSDVETAVGRLKTLSGFGGLSRDELANSLLDIAAKSGRGLEEVAETAFDIASALTADAEAIEVLDKVMQAAVGTFGEAKPIAEGLVTTMNAYGLGAEEASRSLNILLGAQDKGKTDFAQLASAMGQVAATAANMGLEVEDTAGLVAGLSTSTSSISEAATQLNAILAAVQRNAEELGQVVDINLLRTNPVKFLLELDRAAKETGQSLLTMLGRQEAVRGVAGAVKNMQGLIDALNASRDPIQTFEDLYLSAAETIAVKYGQLKGQLRAIFFDIGRELAPTLKRGLDGAAALLERNRESIKRYAAFAGGFVRETVTLLDSLGSTIAKSDLFKGGIGDGLRKSFLSIFEFIAEAAKRLTPILVRSYFEMGAAAGSAVISGLKASFSDPKPLSREIEKAQADLARLRPPAFDEDGNRNPPKILSPEEGVLANQISSRLAKMIQLRDRYGESTTKLLPALEILIDTEERLSRAYRDTTDALRGLKVAGEDGLNFALGASAVNDLGSAVDAYVGNIRRLAGEKDRLVSIQNTLLGSLSRDLALGFERVSTPLKEAGTLSRDLALRFDRIPAPAIDAGRAIGSVGDKAGSTNGELQILGFRLSQIFSGAAGAEASANKILFFKQLEASIGAASEKLKGLYARFTSPPEPPPTLEEESQKRLLSFAETGTLALQRLEAASQDAWNNMASDIALVSVDHLVEGLGAIIDGTKSVSEAFADMAKSMLSDISRIILRTLILNAIQGASGISLFSADGNAFGSGGQLLKAANGAAFSRFGQAEMFARGGVVSRATPFQWGGGKLGVMGEAGPEAILPLKRRNGRLGVEAGGGGGMMQNVAITIHAVDSVSFEQRLAAPGAARLVESIYENAVATRPGFGKG